MSTTTALTCRQRVQRLFAGEPIDFAPSCEDFWKETRALWVKQGHLAEGEDYAAHFGFDIRRAGWLSDIANLDWKTEVLAETDETITARDGNYAIRRVMKHRSGMPEHVGFGVEEREDWERLIKPHLLDFDPRRIKPEDYRQGRALADERQDFLCWHYKGPFEFMHPIIGHETMLMAMLEEPEWIHDMCQTHVDMIIRHAEALFADGGEPDGVWFFEDLGFKQKPFLSPALYVEMLQPYHAQLFDWVHRRGLKVILHSCGFVEPLVPHLIDAGIDCLQAMEVKAGMDLPRLARQYKDRIAFFGNIDVRMLSTNDRAAIDAELDRVITPMMEMGARYLIHSDHSIPHVVEHDTLMYMLDQARARTATGASLSV